MEACEVKKNISITKRLASLNQIGMALMRESDETRLPHLIAETARDLTGAQFAALSLRAPDEEGHPTISSEDAPFFLAAVVGVTSEQEALLSRMPLGSVGVFSPLFRHGLPILFPDISAHSFRAPGATRKVQRDGKRAPDAAYAYRYSHAGEWSSLQVLPVRSFLGVPVLDRTGEIYGGLLLGHAEPGQLDEADQIVMMSLAGQVAMVLENARVSQLRRWYTQHLDAIFDSITDGVMLVGQDGSVVHDNRAARQLRATLAASPEEERSLEALLHTPARHALSGEHEEQTVHLNSLPNGERDYLVTAQPLQPFSAFPGLVSRGPLPLVHSAEAQAGAVVVWHDITEQRIRQSERAAKVQARQQEAIFEAMVDAVFVYDRQGRVVRTNAAGEALLARCLPPGVLEQPLRGRVARLAMLNEDGQLLPPEQALILRVMAGEVLTPATAVEACFRTLAGETIVMSYTGGPLYSATGKPAGAVLVLRDVTEQKRLEQVAQEARAQVEARLALLQLILDELPSSVYLVCGQQARLVLANGAAAQVWGATWLQDQPMQDFLSENQVRLFSENGQPIPLENLATLRAVRSGETIRQRQETIRRPNGSTLPVLVSAVALGPSSALRPLPAATNQFLTEPGEPMALVVLQDVSALKEAEHLKDEFISIAAHELRNPIAVLAGYSNMLLMQTERGKGPKLVQWQREALEEMDRAAQRLVNLTEDLLDVTRLQAGRLRLEKIPVDLVTLVQRVVGRLQMTTERHHLTVNAQSKPQGELQGEPLCVLIDPSRMEQVLSNLLNNAIKYSPEGGPIDIEVKLQEEDTKRMALFSIRDHGIGIPRGQQARLFGRFVRADNARASGISGTGLGLYLCRELVQQHEGQIWFESEEGVGTTFFLALPLYTDS